MDVESYTLSDLFPDFSTHLSHVNEEAKRNYGNHDIDLVEKKLDRTARDSVIHGSFFENITWEDPDQIIQDIQPPINGLTGRVMAGRSEDRLTEEHLNNYEDLLSNEQCGDLIYIDSGGQEEIADISYPSIGYEMMKNAVNNDIELFHAEKLPIYMEIAVENIDHEEYRDLVLNYDKGLEDFLSEGKESAIDEIAEVSTPIEISDESDIGSHSHRRKLLEKGEATQGMTAISTCDKRLLWEWMNGDYEDVAVYTPKLLSNVIVKDQID